MFIVSQVEGVILVRAESVILSGDEGCIMADLHGSTALTMTRVAYSFCLNPPEITPLDALSYSPSNIISFNCENNY